MERKKLEFIDFRAKLKLAEWSLKEEGENIVKLVEGS